MVRTRSRTLYECDTTLVRRSLLPGGLRVVSEQMPGVRSASVGLWIAAGSRDESRTQSGAAHYLEHLLFKGTRRRSARRIAEEVDAVGGELNAFTEPEYTCFYAHVLDSELPLAVDVLCDVVFDAMCAGEDVDIERNVILDEIAMRDDDPEDLLGEVFTSAVLGGHPLARSVLGDADSIRAMTRTRVRGFHRRHYTFPGAVLAVAGNIEHTAVLRAARRALGDRLEGAVDPLPARRGRARLPRQQPLEVRCDQAEHAHLMLGCRGLDRHDDRRFVQEVLNVALGGGMSSRLFQEVRERRGLSYSVYSTVASYADAGMLGVYAGCQPERLGELAQVITGELHCVADGGLGADEVARARAQLHGNLVLALEDSGARMQRLGRSEINHGQYFPVEESLRRIDEVTAGQVADLAAELLRRPLTAAVVGPYAAAEELPAELHSVVGTGKVNR